MPRPSSLALGLFLVGCGHDVPEHDVDVESDCSGRMLASSRMSVRERLESLGITLPTATNPAANYANTVLTGNLLFVAGKGPLPFDGKLPKGKLGREYSADEGYAFARSAGIDILAAVTEALGELDRVARVVKLQGFVNATPDFEDHASVLNGCSDLMVQVFGPNGAHARSVFGAVSLRNNLPIVVDSIFEVR